MVTFNKLAAIIILLAAFLVIGYILLGPDKGLDKAKSIFSTIVDYLPNISFGAKELQGTPPVYAPEVETSLKNLKSVIEVMIQSDENNCFMQFAPLPDLTGENEEGEEITNIISFTVSGENSLMQLSDSKGRLISSETWEFKPCVIAGGSTGNIASNFYANFLEAGAKCSGCIWGSCPPEENCQLPYWLVVPQLQIFYNSGWLVDDGNQLIFGLPAAETGDNFLNGGYLFKPSPGVICLFPTKKGEVSCDGDDAYGLDDDCLIDDTEEGSIPYRLKRGQLNYCH